MSRRGANKKAHRESPGAIMAMKRYHKDIVEPKRALIRKYVTVHPKEVEEIRARNSCNL